MLYCVTGSTLGKGNLIFRDYGKHVFTIYSRSTRKGCSRGVPRSKYPG
ncbi:MAG: formylmethanofuran dehydrogenase subunit E family protein [Desulfobacterales bacterium]